MRASGQGPLILEMLTYRYRGHSMSDPAKYRTREEVNRMRAEHDPIDQARQRLLEAGTPEAELKQIESAVRDRRRRSGAVRPGQPRARAERAVDGRSGRGLSLRHGEEGAWLPKS